MKWPIFVLIVVISLYHRGKAEELEQKITAGEIESSEDDDEVIAESRKWAANWLITEANCLKMPEPRPTSPLPEEPEQ